jgi:hypothetical protein
MLSAALTLYLRVLEESFTWLGQSPARVLGLIVIVIVGAVIAFATSGPEGLRVDVQSLAKALAAPILVWLVIFAIQVIRVPYHAYRQQSQTAITQTTRVAELERILDDRRHDVDPTEPGVSNMLAVIRAFQNHARAIGPRPPGSTPAILVSAAEDSKKLAWDVTQWAVFAGFGGNGDLQNIGVSPENLDVESKRGMVPNLLLIHAVKHTPAVQALVDSLSVLLPTRLVYTMPDTDAPVPSDVLWLQFGPGVRWHNDSRDRQ